MSTLLHRTLCDQPSDAEAWYRLSLTTKLNSTTGADNDALKRALVLRPDWRQTREAMEPRSRSGIRSTRPVAWPSKAARFADLRKLIDDYIVKPDTAPAWSLSRSSRLFTFGSCFATNISRALLSRGYQSFHLSFNEEINSTFANRHLLDWLSGSNSPQAVEIGDFFGREVRDKARDALSQCDAAVMTLGVAPCFFTEKGEFVFVQGETAEGRRGLVFRMTTVAENVANLRAILASLQALSPNIHVIFTVSPIPLNGVVGMGSAVLADCLSKSTLRTAVSEVEGATYFPAFEIVKWLGSHTDRAFFGTEDGDTRYVSADAIDHVIDAFVRQFVRECEH